MNSGQRTAVSLLVTAALFTGFVFSVYSSVFSKIEAKFYEPERIALERTKLNESADFCNEYIQNLLIKTSKYSESPSVLSYFSQTPSESEVTERVNLSGELFAELTGLDGFRLLDKNGRNVHYSSYTSDIVKQNGTTKIYKNYADISAVSGESDFQTVSISESADIPPYKISFNKERHLLNLSIPVYDGFKMYRGNFVFYFKTLDLERELVKRGYVSVGESLTLLVSEDNLFAGFLLGLPKIGMELFENPVIDSWKSKASGPETVLYSDDEQSWIILSDYSSAYIPFSGVYKSGYFELPASARILILVCVFITLFLIMFLLFSFKIDDMVVIRSRIKKIQFAFVAEYLENRESVDWNQVARQIEDRREDLFRDVKQSLGRKGRKYESQIDTLLNKSWEEILSAIGARQSYENKIAINNKDTSAELKKMLEEVLSKSEIKVKTISAPEPVSVGQETSRPVKKSESVEELDEVEELSDVETVEELDEVEDLSDAETAEELSDADTAEELDAVAELSDVESAEELDEEEELSDVETAEELDEVEELKDAEIAEEISEIEDTESASEPIEEIEEETEDTEETEEVSEIVEEEPELSEEPEESEEVSEVSENLENSENSEPVELSESQENAEVSEITEPDEISETESLDENTEFESVEEIFETENISETEIPSEEISEEVFELEDTE